MSLSGWFLLFLSVGGTTGFLLWCFLRVLRHHKKAHHLHAPTDLDPRDVDP